MIRVVKFLCVLAAVALAVLTLEGCASDTMEDLSYWWNAKVKSVGRVTGLPTGIDRSCIRASNAKSTPDEEQAIVVTYRVGKATITKAYPELAGIPWQAGDSALVHPDSCRIKRPPAFRDQT